MMSLLPASHQMALYIHAKPSPVDNHKRTLATRTWGLGHQKSGLHYYYLIPSLPSVAMDPVKMHVANGKPAGGEGWVWCAYPQQTSDVRRTKVFSRATTRLFSPSHQSLCFYSP